jgi:hypothetical protein
MVVTRPQPAPVARPSRGPVFGYVAPAPPPRHEARRPDHDRHRGHHYGRGVAFGVSAALIGATLGYRYYRGPDRETVYERCDRNFPEFDYDSGTYTNADGNRDLCPYLRAFID